MNTFYPKLSELFNPVLAGNGISSGSSSSVLNNIFYKNLIVNKSTDDSSIQYSLEIVIFKDKLGFEFESLGGFSIGLTGDNFNG